MTNFKSIWDRNDSGPTPSKGESTLVIIKPDAMARGLAGEIISRIERKGLEIMAMRFCQIKEAEAKALYMEHEAKNYFQPLVDFTISGPSIIMVVRGNEATSVVRAMMGSTDCATALPGTIRGDFGISSFERTLMHGSRNADDFDREWRIFDWKQDSFRDTYRTDAKAAYSERDA